MNTRGFFGSMLQAIGMLIMILSGLCSGIVVVVGGPGILIEFLKGNFSVISAAALPLIFGGIPFLIGLGIYMLGKPSPESGAGGPKIGEIEQRNDNAVTFAKKDGDNP